MRANDDGRSVGQDADVPAVLPRRVFLAIAVAAQAITIGITWPLWQVRDAPPNLPWLDLPQVSYGPLLLITLAVMGWRPAFGWWLHVACLGAATASDQLRVQPQMISVPFLMLLAFRSPSARLLGLSHLGALWFYSGFHKLLSPRYFTEVSGWMLKVFYPSAPEALATATGAMIAFVEITIGVLVFIPALRRTVAVAALALHLGILLTLSPLGAFHNESIWSWNLVLAAVGPLILWRWPQILRAQVRSARHWARALAAAWLVLPLGYYAGVHAHLCFCLYTKNKPMAWIERPGWTRARVGFWKEMQVPIPPAHGTIAAYFRAVAQPGDRVEVVDERGWARGRGLDHYWLSYEIERGLPQALLQELGAGKMEPHSGPQESILYRIDLSGASIDDAALQRLAALEGLVELDVRGTPVTDTGLLALLAAPKLERLRIHGTGISSEARSLFHRERPDVTLDPE